ncbi:20945_t:CDS:2 [Entrophospora sp. SA101]|nr:20945_t:CDS:2 [Entrophospora sp. SA101]
MSSDYNNIKNLCETIIFKISKTLNNKDNDDNLLGKKDGIFNCDKASIYLLNQCIKDLKIYFSSASEKLYSFPYKDVAICWLRLYTDASLIKSVFIKNLDMALVMTNAPGYERKELIFSLIEEEEKEKRKFPKYEKLDNPISTSKSSTKSTISSSLIPKIPSPSISYFTSHVTSNNPTPFIITSSISHWPALSTTPWSDMNYLLNKIGKNRLVPVEIGAKYTDNSWTQKLISFEEFVNNWILSNDLIENYNTDNKIEDRKEEAKVVNKEQKEIAYLAQHNLFDQIPSLKDDILIPDYCFVNTVIPFSNLPSSTNNSNDVDDDYNNCKGNENNQKPRKYNPPPDVIINAWFGPKGTISPMHTDPYHNLLAQVVGKKYIRLYSPEETTNLYPFEQDGFLGNTSQVDVEAPDLERFSRFASAKYQECILEPGELLYIPPGWWHYVKSLTISFSVSFWF